MVTGGDSENQIRDAILSKGTSDYVRRKPLEEGSGLTLASTLELAACCESIDEQMADMPCGSTKSFTDTVNRLALKEKKVKHGYGNAKGKPNRDHGNDGKCYRSGNTDHIGRDPKCPARGQMGHKCQGKDHFAKVCRTKGRKPKQNVYNVDGCVDLGFAIEDNHMPERLSFCVGGVNVKMLIDWRNK